MNHTGPIVTDDHDRYPTLRTSVFVLCLLVGTYVLGFLDKQILTLTVDDVSRAFSIGDSEIGILQGVAFSLPSAALALPLGFLVDRTNRRNLLLGSIALWSLATIGCGLSATYGSFLFWRTVVGAGEAGVPALAFSLLGDIFAPRHRAKAALIFFAASSLCSSVSMVLGGAMLRSLASGGSARSIFNLEPWRLGYMTLGIAGVLLASVLLFIREPSRKERVVTSGPTGASGYLLAHWRTLGPFMIGGGLVAAVTIAYTAWFPVLISRTFHADNATAGMIYGAALVPMILIAAATAPLIMRRYDPLVAAPRAVLVGLWISLVAIVCLPFATSMPVAVALGSLQLFAYVWLAGLLPKMYLDLVPNQFRGQLVSLGTVIQLVLLSIVPTAIGMVSGQQASDASSLQSALLWVSAPAWLLAMLCFLAIRSSYARTVREWRGDCADATSQASIKSEDETR